MSRRLIYLISFVFVLFLVSNVQAAPVTWTGAGPDHFWSTPQNWDTGILPISTDAAKIDMLPGPTITNQDVAVVDLVSIGLAGGIGALTVNGGSLTTINQLQLGYNSGSDGTLTYD